MRVRLLGIGVLAVGVVIADVAVLPGISHDIDVKKATKARAAYLAAERAPLTAAYAALGPLSDALTKQEAGSGSGIDYPVRDALAHSVAPAALASAAAAFDKVAAPKDLATKATATSAALHALATDTKAMSGLGSLTDEALGDAFATGGFSKLQPDLGGLGTAVTALYEQAPSTAPHLPATNPANHDGWLLTVDLLCQDGEKTLATRSHATDPTIAQFESDITISVQAATTLQAGIRKTPLPPGDAAAKALVARLGVMDRLISAQTRLKSALQAQDQAAFEAALRDESTAEPDLGALSTSFTAYGLTECATFYGVDKSDDSGSSNGGKSA